MRNRSRSRSRVLPRVLDRLSGLLVIGSLLFAPWAFGTVHPVSIRIMNGMGYALGLITLWQIWSDRKHKQKTSTTASSPGHHPYGWLPSILAAFSVAIVLYAFIHAINARSTFDPPSLSYTYNESFISWLPHSFDSAKSWPEWFRILAMTCYFWGTYYWLGASPQKSSRRRENEVPLPEEGPESPLFSRPLPRRVTLMLTVMAVNAGLIAFVGILQKLDGSGRLLWILEPNFLKKSIHHFGPFAYRGNAASFLNLSWPLSLLLFVNLMTASKRIHGSSRTGSSSYIALVPPLGLAFLGCLATDSRAGAALAIGLVIPTVIALEWRSRSSRRRRIVFGIALLAVSLTAFQFLAGTKAFDRLRSTARTLSGKADLQEQRAGRVSGRTDIYRHLPPMFRDHATWGSGPGTFASIYHLYRGEGRLVWGNYIPIAMSAWAHCDPAEFLITFGVPGTLLLVIPLGLILWTIPITRKRSSHFNGHDHWILLVGLGGLLTHSLFDFPLQVYSVLHLFIVTLAITTRLSQTMAISAGSTAPKDSLPATD